MSDGPVPTLRRRPNLGAIRSEREVAMILGISRSAVWQGEQRAFRKLRCHPILLQLARDCGWAPTLDLTEETPS
jgi:DNA-directed RNA polymerase sigma subunit (sigma70/sigma32)